MGVRDVAVSGDRRATLEATRDRLAEALDEVAAKDVAPVARQLQSVLAELDGLPAAKEVSVVDELGARRSERRAKAAGS